MGAFGTCKVCDRKDIGVIDVQLESGKALLAVARDHGVPEASLRDHWKRCRKKGKALRPVSPELPPVSTEITSPLLIPPLPADDPRAAALADLQMVHATAQLAYARADADKDNRAIALLVPQLRQNIVKTIEILMKGRKEVQTPAERLMQNPEFSAASKVLFETLDGFPEAKLAVMGALERFVGAEGSDY